jgi:hypothetical protein
MARRKSPKPPEITDASPALPKSPALGQVLKLTLRGKSKIAGLAVGTVLSLLLKYLPTLIQIAAWYFARNPASLEHFKALGSDVTKLDPEVQKAIEVWEKQEAKNAESEPAPPKATSGTTSESPSEPPQGVAGGLAHPEEFGTERDEARGG